jgi:prevent-host-death family protein
MAAWPVQDAKARFGEMLHEAVLHGPQIVTDRGVETAVVVPIGVWRSMESRQTPTLKDWLLAPEPRLDENFLDFASEDLSFPLREVSFE